MITFTCVLGGHPKGETMKIFDENGQLTTEIAAHRLLRDRISRIERELGLPTWTSGFEPDVSEAGVMSGKLPVGTTGILWPDCGGDAECVECSRRTLATLEGPLNENPTALSVSRPFVCSNFGHEAIAS